MRNATLKLTLLALLILLPGCTDDDPMAPVPAAQSPAPQLTVVATAKVSAGMFQTCALRSTGIINCWGRNTYYEAPDYWAGDAYRHYVDVSAGEDISCGVLSDGFVNCRGKDVTVTYPNWLLPVVGRKYIQVTTGDESFCALRDDGLINCRGTNLNGQTLLDWSGNGGIFNAVATNDNHTCAIRMGDGAMECRGSNANGAAPTGPDYTYMGAVSVGVGTQSTCQTTYMWAVRCIGAGSVVTNVPGGNTHLQVTVGPYHACALQTNGSVKCWGSNGYGEAPATRTASDGVAYTQVDAGDFHTCAMRADDLVECWGLNHHGQAMSEQGISFTSAPTTAQIGDIVRIEVETTSGLPVSFGTSPGFRCGWHAVGDDYIELNMLDSGVCSIQVSQAGTAAFRAAQTIYTDISISTPPAPAAPSNAVVTAVAGALTLTWNDNSNNETSFLLFQRSAALADVFGEYQPVWDSNVPANATSYGVGSTTPGNKYQFAVQSCTGSTCSDLVESNVIEAPVLAPAVPGNMTGSALTTTSIRITWQDLSDNETKFRLQRRVWNGSAYDAWTSVGTRNADATSFDDNTVTMNTWYQYRLRACNGTDCSAYVTSKRILAQVKPATPTGLTATATASGVNLAWADASNNESSFELQRQIYTGSWSAFSAVGSANANETGFAHATGDTGRFRYRIRACNVMGCSTYLNSNAVTR